jgi:ribonuclease HIII
LKKQKDYQAHEAAIQSLREFVARKGWSIDLEREIDYGYQIAVFDGKLRNPVDFFPSGKILIKGNAGVLRDALHAWKEERNAAAEFKSDILPLPFPETQTEAISLPSPTINTRVMPLPIPTRQKQAPPVASTAKQLAQARIVLGVAGKDDYFGPLVISALYVDAWAEAQFSMLGIHDMALLRDDLMLAKAEKIKAICAHSLVIIGPTNYNKAYETTRNQESIWAWGNVRAIVNILEKATCNIVVAHQLGDISIIETALAKKGHQVILKQSMAPQEDLALAAATVLAHAEYVQCLDQLAQRIGQSLPKGISDEMMIKIGREVVARGGKNALAEVAKLQFEVTKAILQIEESNA